MLMGSNTFGLGAGVSIMKVADVADVLVMPGMAECRYRNAVVRELFREQQLRFACFSIDDYCSFIFDDCSLL